MNTSVNPEMELLEDARSETPLFVCDAFSNPEYLRFALAGTAASMLCYVIYVGLHWPGISTAVTTCALTALSDIGSSRQKQLLRIVGAFIGGFGFGLGSQMLILPGIDSIVGLTILLACVTGLSAWVATSSARLSYVGLQMAFAFYLINVTDFSISLDLTIARDRAVGVLLGIAAMWLVFERLYPRPAAVQMVRMFAHSARLVASLTSISAGEFSIARVRALRDQIAASFSSVNAEADAVLFESGARRYEYLAARNRLRRWLSTLRTFYLLELPLLPSGAREDSELIPIGRQTQAPLPTSWSISLTRIAECLESQLNDESQSHPDSFGTTEAAIRKRARGASSSAATEIRVGELPSQLSRLVAELERDVLSEPLFS